jgi:hypothetical protein
MKGEDGQIVVRSGINHLPTRMQRPRNAKTKAFFYVANMKKLLKKKRECELKTARAKSICILKFLFA